jgi:hypothetical protein
MSLISVISGSDRSVPNAPTIGTATNNGGGRTFVSGGRADVTFTAPTYTGRLPITNYTVTSSPGGFTGTGGASPISVTGLTPGTNYTFTVTATNSVGTSAASAASNSITATTIPQVPTITSATRTSNTAVSIAFTGSTGGATISAVTATSSPSVSITSSGTSSPMTATATYVQGTSYTFTITATNANGTSTASNTSSAVIPSPAPVLGAWSASTAYPSTFDRRNAAGGMTSNAIAWFGTGTADGINGVATGFYWNGSTWTNQNYGASVASVGMNRISTTQFMGVSGNLNFDPGQTTNATYYGTGTSAFTFNGNLPTNAPSSSILKVSDGYLVVGGQSDGSAAYYKAALDTNTWTARGSGSFPGGANVGNGVGLNFTTGYIVPFNGGGTSNIYSVSSMTGAFTNVVGNPNSGQPLATYVFANINDRTIFYATNSNAAAGASYLFNGSTFTASTTLPDTTWQWAGAAVGNVMSIVKGTNHYRATLA